MINLRVNAQKILDKVAGYDVESEGGVLAICPCHEDTHPSLKIDISDKETILLHCRAGCTFRELAKFFEISPTDKWKWPDNLEVSNISSDAKSVGTTELNDLHSYVEHAVSLFRDSEARTYCRERFGLSQADSGLLRLGYSPANDDSVSWGPIESRWQDSDRLVVPFLNFDGKPAGAQARTLTSSTVKWTGLRNVDNASWSRYAVMDRRDGLDYIIITEGPSDGLTAFAAGFSALVVRGASLSKNSTLSDEISSHLKDRIVIVAGDADPSGDQFSENLVKSLNRRGVDARRLKIPEPHNDLNDWYIANKESFQSELEEAVRQAPVSISASGISNTWNDLPGDHPISLGVTNASAGRALMWYIHKTNRYVNYVRGFGLCIFDDGKYWLNDPDSAALRVRRVLQEAQLEASKFSDDTHPLAGNIRALGNKLGMTYFANSTLTEVGAIVQHLSADDFDSDPNLLLAQNGAINLLNGKLLEPDPSMNLSKELAINYNPDAECPRWESFIREVMDNNQEMADFLRRLVGYGITGHTTEQVFAILHGHGANGKSVFTNTLSNTFAAITKTAPFAVFEKSSFGSGGAGPSSHIARLRGSRITLTSEGEEGRPMNESLIKSLTGGDVITARHMRSEEFEFKTQHLIMMASNHLPRFVGADEGLWRRVMVIKFDRYFAPHERDYNLEQILEGEAEGILAWAVRGAVEWARDGLNIPPQVTASNSELRETNDALHGFLPGIVKEDKAHAITLKKLYEHYRNWADEESNDYPLGKQRFRQRVQDKGIEYKRLADGYGFDGIRFMSKAEQEAYLLEMADG